MAVKDDLLKWVTTNKSEVIAIDDETGNAEYVTFRAAEAAADLGIRKEAASNALSSLKSEGLVTLVETDGRTGIWAWTGATPVEGEKVPRKRAASKSKDPVESARENLRRALEGVTFQWQKADDKEARLIEEQEKISVELDLLTKEKDRLEAALEALGE